MQFLIVSPQALNQSIFQGRQWDHAAHPSDDPEQSVAVLLVGQIGCNLAWLCAVRVTKAALPEQRFLRFGQLPLDIDPAAISEEHRALHKAQTSSSTQQCGIAGRAIASNIPIRSLLFEKA